MRDINVERDVALCRACAKTYSYADLLGAHAEIKVDLDHPPKGAWFRRLDDGFETGVSTRHPIALFLVPFMLVWSGFSVGGIYGRQIYNGKFELSSSLFGIPFLLGTLLFGSIAVMATCGRITVNVRNNQGTILVGVGSIGWRRRFAWDQVESVRETISRNSKNQSRQITIRTDRDLNVASGLSDQRFDFLLGALRQMLQERHTGG